MDVLEQQHTVTLQQRNLLALDAISDDTAAVRWRHLDQTASTLAQRIQVLAAALPAAEAREAEAARKAEEQARATEMEEFRRRTQEARRFIEGVLAALPTGETLTAARNHRDRVGAAARSVRRWSSDIDARRPVDPLDVVVTAMQHRIDRVSRARWAEGAPITLTGGASAETMGQAAARVATAERKTS